MARELDVDRIGAQDAAEILRELRSVARVKHAAAGDLDRRLHPPPAMSGRDRDDVAPPARVRRQRP